MELKCGRRTFNVSDKDLILFNGACYTLVTQTFHHHFEDVKPTVPKSTFNRLFKEGKIIESNRKYIDFFGKSDGYTLYTFKGE